MDGTTRDHHGVACAEPHPFPIGELQIDRAFKNVDELEVALMIVPARGTFHCLLRDHDLGPGDPIRRVLNAKIDVLKETASTPAQPPAKRR